MYLSTYVASPEYFVLEKGLSGRFKQLIGEPDL